MKFEYFNPNPDAKTFKSGKPKYWSRDDNSVRALSKVLNKELILLHIYLTTIQKFIMNLQFAVKNITICQNQKMSCLKY